LTQFGAGHRSCLGKNISYLEIYKVVPTMLRAFDVSSLAILLSSPVLTCLFKFELVGPEEGGDWNVQNRWFVVQSGFNVRMRKRQQQMEFVKVEN
jgi:hypothetical protein